MSKLLNAVAVTGKGPKQISQVPFTDDITFQVVVTGAPSQVTIKIHAALDQETTEEIMTHDVTANGNMFTLSGYSFNAIEGELFVLTGSGTVTLIMQPKEF